MFGGRVLANRRILLIGACVLTLCLSAARATAADDPAAAKEAYRVGLLQYNLGDYDKALAQFRAAYLAHPDPAFLFNIAQCQRQLAQFDAAGKSYRAFLRESPNVSDEMRTDVQRLINEMDEAVREQRAKAPPTGTQPPHEMTQSPATRPATTPAKPLPRPAPDARRPWYKNALGLGITGGGLAVAVVGAGLLGKASADDSSSRTALTLPDQRGLHDSANTFQAAGLALIGVGAAVTIAGTVVLALGARHKRTQTEARR